MIHCWKILGFDIKTRLSGTQVLGRMKLEGQFIVQERVELAQTEVVAVEMYQNGWIREIFIKAELVEFDDGLKVREESRKEGSRFLF